MHTGFAQMRRIHHRPQCRFNRTARVGQEIGDTCQRLVFFGIENMQDRADQKAVAGLFPMVAPFERTFGIDKNVRDVLDVTNLVLALPDLWTCNGFAPVTYLIMPPWLQTREG